jgi:hypothetical protein
MVPKSICLHHNTITLFAIAILQLLNSKTTAQDSIHISRSTALKELASTKVKIKPILALEAWQIIPINEDQISNDAFFRRLRFGAKGKIAERFSYTFQLHADRLFQNTDSPIKGEYKGIEVWNAYASNKMLRNSNLLNIHAGYFWSAMSGEYQTSPWTYSALDKSTANNYLRKFVSGKGNGIISGLALGGVTQLGALLIDYKAGYYYPHLIGNVTGNEVFSSRISLSIGKKAESKYTFMMPHMVGKKMKLLRMGFGAAYHQSGGFNDSLFIHQSNAFSFDLMARWQNILLNTEFAWLSRYSDTFTDFKGKYAIVNISVWMNIGKTILEPALHAEYYKAHGSVILFSSIQNHTQFDTGINWYLREKKLKLALHYIVQRKELDTTNNSYAALALQYKL